ILPPAPSVRPRPGTRRCRRGRAGGGARAGEWPPARLLRCAPGPPGFARGGSRRRAGGPRAASVGTSGPPPGRWAARSRAARPPRQEEPVEVHTDDDVALGRREEHADVVEPAVQSMKVGPGAQGANAREVTEALEAADQTVEGDERAAALGRGERRGGEENEAHAPALAPLKLGRPLLEERPRPLLVVLALERLERQVLQLPAALLRQPEEVR